MVSPPATGRELLEHLYDTRYREYRRVAGLAAGDWDVADDMVHDAFVIALRKVDGLKNPDAIDAWMYRILINRIRSHQRRAGRTPQAHEPTPHDDSPAVAANQRIDIARALRKLPRRQRTVVALRYFTDLTYAEIGQVLGIREGTVAATLHKAHTQLETTLSTEVER